METIINLVGAVLEEAHLKYMAHNENNVFMPMKSDTGIWNVLIHLNESEDCLTVYSVFPFCVPENKRNQMAKKIANINYCLCVGNFEMDLRDGELRYRTGLVLGSAQPTKEIIEPVIFVNFKVMDQLYPDIMKVLFDDGSGHASFSGDLPDKMIDSIEHWLKEIDSEDQDGSSANPEA